MYIEAGQNIVKATSYALIYLYMCMYADMYVCMTYVCSYVYLKVSMPAVCLCVRLLW